MRLISHRGNITSKIPYKENTQQYINDALVAGFDVEIDVWKISDKWYLGHDSATNEIYIDFLKSDNLLCHAKNKDAFEEMLQCKSIHCFWHQEDTYTLTSRGIPIIYPGKDIIKNSIVMEKCMLSYNDIQGCYGICSDKIQNYKGNI